MKKTYFFILFLLSAAGVRAGERSDAQMRSIAAARLNTAAGVRASSGRDGAVLQLQRVADDPAYSVFAPDEGAGFVVVAKSTKADPVIGYSDGKFDKDNLPPAMRWYLGEVSRNLQDIESGRRQAPRRAATFTPVEPFITTTWDQAYPFDRKTPNNYPSGCVATALAQCLNYCQYPASASFEGHYSLTTTTGKKTTTENKTEEVSSTYTWPYKDTYKSFGRYGDNIDELMRDCGYAAYMEYSKQGSGTPGYLAGIALTSCFSYPQASVKQIYYQYVSDRQWWNQTIYDELALRSPIIYGASDKEFGGHAFVFCGVDAEGMVYVNWGWSGVADGFYDIWALTPDDGKERNDFSDGQHMTYGIRPQALPTDRVGTRLFSYTSEPYTFRWGVEVDDKEVERHTLYADLPYGIVNISATDFEGTFGLFAKDLTDGTEWIIAEELQDRDTIPAGYSFGGSSEQWKDFGYYYYIDGENGLKPGHTYHMSFGIRNDHEGTWHSILADGGEVGYRITYSGDPATSTVEEENIGAPVSTGICVPRTVDALTPADGLTRVFDTSGRLVYTAPSAGFNLWDVPARGVLVVKQGGKSRKVVR